MECGQAESARAGAKGHNATIDYIDMSKEKLCAIPEGVAGVRLVLQLCRWEVGHTRQLKDRYVLGKT
jgi:hypothetical protein